MSRLPINGGAGWTVGKFTMGCRPIYGGPSAAHHFGASHFGSRPFGSGTARPARAVALGWPPLRGQPAAMAADGAALVAAAVQAAVHAKAPRKTVAATAAAAVASVLGAQRAGAAPGPRAPAGAERSPPPPPPAGASPEALLEAMRATARARRARKRARRKARRDARCVEQPESTPKEAPLAAAGQAAMVEHAQGAAGAGDGDPRAAALCASARPAPGTRACIEQEERAMELLRHFQAKHALERRQLKGKGRGRRK
jgi:hypothetical protein